MPEDQKDPKDLTVKDIITANQAAIEILKSKLKLLEEYKQLVEFAATVPSGDVVERTLAEAASTVEARKEVEKLRKADNEPTTRTTTEV